MRYATSLILFFLLISPALLLSGCTSSTFDDLIRNTEQLVDGSEFERKIISTTRFDLVSFQKTDSENNTLRIYIEGDGRAWITRWRPSLNPTPLNPLALKLALQDNEPVDIVYLARPCQFVRTIGVEQPCSPEYWLNKRYSKDVVNSFSEAIDLLKEQTVYSSVELVGFSGGGTIALLLSAQRNDISLVRTVAGNLDTDKFTELHKVSPLKGSLNPADFSQQLVAVPQIHFYGEKDQVITRAIVDAYSEKLNRKNCISIMPVSDASHTENWESNWDKLLQEKVMCKATIK